MNGVALVFGGCQEVFGMGEHNQQIADWISNYLQKNSLVDKINESNKLKPNKSKSPDSSSLSPESWGYIESILDEAELLAMACKDLGIETDGDSGGIIYKISMKQ